MSESEKVAWKFQRAWMRLLEDGQHIIETVELVVPLLLAVVHEAEKLAEAHVVYLRGGGRVSSGEGRGSRQVPNGGR